MEKRAVLAFALSALLLFLYVWVQEQYFSPPRPPETATSKPPAKPGGADAPKPPPVTEAARDKPAPTPVAPLRPAEASGKPRGPQRTARVDGPLYRAVVSSDGGKL